MSCSAAKSFVALAEGCRIALWTLGRAPLQQSQRQPVSCLPQS